MTPNKSASDIAFEQIRLRIIEGEYRPSQRLVEATLATSLGVSRHNVRVALDRLQSVGLVHIEPNVGATVAALTLDDALDTLQAREALEVEVAKMATARIDDDAAERLDALVAIMREALAADEFDRYSATNRAFHDAIFELSGNRTIPELIGLLRLRMAQLQLRTILIPGRAEKSLAEHAAICEALKARDPVRTEAVVRTHIGQLREAIEKAWSLVRL